MLLLICILLAAASGKAFANVSPEAGILNNAQTEGSPTAVRSNFSATQSPDDPVPVPSNHFPLSFPHLPLPLRPHSYSPPRSRDFEVSAIPIPYEPSYFTERTKSDMLEFLDRAARDIDFAESQISLAAEFARTAIANDMNEARNFVIKNHEAQLNEATYLADENGLWECAKKGEKMLEVKARSMADRVSDCVRRASRSAMDVVSSSKSHVAEDRTRRMQKYNEDVARLAACRRQQERHCVREQSSLIDRNFNGLAADAKSEVERVREARRQQIAQFGVCRIFQDRSYIELLALSDRIIDNCLKGTVGVAA